MSPRPNLALQIPTYWGEQVPDTEHLLSFCRRADELGFHSLWVTDRPIHKINLPHPLTMLTYTAACTERIGLGTAVFLLSLRQPLEVARQTATLDMLAGGRLTLGVSLGGRDYEYEAMNAPKRQRVGRLEEGMAVLRKLWTETDVTFHGRYYHLEKANVSPKPPRPGGIPLPMGANTEPGLQRTGRLADGWLMGQRGTPEQFVSSWQVVQEAALEAGRDPSALTNCKFLYANVDTDRDRGQQELQRYLEAYHGPGFPMDQTVVGSPQEIAQAVRAFGDAGCQTVALGLPAPDVAKLEWLAAEVMPALE